MRIFQIVIAFAFIIVTTAFVHAECVDNKENVISFRATEYARQEECWSINPIAVMIEASLPKKGAVGDWDNASQDVVNALKLVQDSVASIEPSNDLSGQQKAAVNKSTVHFRDKITDALKSLDDERRNKQAVQKFNAVPLEIGLGAWQAIDGVSSNWDQVIVQPLQEAGCFDKKALSTNDCERIFNEFKPIAASYALISFRVTKPLVDWYQDVDSKNIIKLEGQWNSYRKDLIFQYPWELFANYKFHGGDQFDKPNFQGGPTSRLLVVHPDVAVLFGDSLNEGNKVNPALVIEWLGFLSWQGYDSITNKVKNPWGVAFTTSFADLAGAKDIGLGVTAHYQKYAISWAKHGSNNMILLNLNLTELLGDKLSDKYKALAKFFK